MNLSPTDSPATLKARQNWVRLYQQTRDAGLTCRRCGISRPTLRKWWRRFQEQGQEGLRSRSRRRHTLPERKVTPQQEQIILALRAKRRLGPERIQSELRRTADVHLSTVTVWKVLRRHLVKPLHNPRRPKEPIRYSRPLPGERVQMDTCKVGKGLYQFMQA